MKLDQTSYSLKNFLLSRRNIGQVLIWVAFICKPGRIVRREVRVNVGSSSFSAFNSDPRLQPNIQ